MKAIYKFVNFYIYHFVLSIQCLFNKIKYKHLSLMNIKIKKSIVNVTCIFVFLNIFLFLSTSSLNSCVSKRNYKLKKILSYIHFTNSLELSIFDHWNISNAITDDPIDIVYTWVNGSDPIWIEKYNELREIENITMTSDTFKIRFIENDELRFSLRSIEKYAIHFIRYIFIVVANDDTQIPFWLNVSNPKIKIITHKTIFNKNDNSIFTFNSNGIENCISNIPGLSETFIYFNDDFFIGKQMNKKDFFTNHGKPKIFVKCNYLYNIEDSYKTHAEQGNDFAGKTFFAGFYYTLFQFQKKFNKITNLEHLHMAYPTTKKIQNGYKEIFKDEVLKTINSPFRRVNDILMQFISFQYGMLKNEIVPIMNGNDESVFVYDDFYSNKNKLIKIYKNEAKMFCVNIDIASQASSIKAFLYIMFPNRSSFELNNAELPIISEENVTYLNSLLNSSSYSFFLNKL